MTKGLSNLLPGVGLAVAIILGLGAAAILFQGLRQGGANLDAFNQKLAVWTEPPKGAWGGWPYIRGKVLPIMYQPYAGGRREVQEELYRQLPADLRANTPEEVDTVVWLEWGEERLGKTRSEPPMTHYTLEGIRYTCKVTIIDKRTNCKVGETSFQGSDPRGKGNYAGDKPYAEILAYLTKLPRRSK
jgi:hypothetical protein